MKTETLTVRLPSRMKSKLNAFSRRENKAASDIVRESLRRYLALQGFRSSRSKILPFAEEQGLLTDEDVFKALK